MQLNVGRSLLWLAQHQHHSIAVTMGEAGKESTRTEIKMLSKRDDIILQDNGTLNVTRNGGKGGAKSGEEELRGCSAR